MSVDNLTVVVWSVMAAFAAVMIYLEISFRRACSRSALFVARFEHRKHLQMAVNAGEGSLEFHAMQCTRCGGFHPEDDEDCEVANGEGKAVSTTLGNTAVQSATWGRPVIDAGSRAPSQPVKIG